MLNQKAQYHFLWIILAATFVLTCFIFRPFIYALVLAAVFATVFQPLYKKISHFIGGQKSIAALVTMLLVTIVIFTPLIFLSFQIVDETSQLYLSISTDAVDSGAHAAKVTGKVSLINYLEKQIGVLQDWFPVLKKLPIDIGQYSQGIASWIIQHLGSIFSGFAKMAVSSFIFLIALFYFLRDGDRFRNTIKVISPLADSDDDVIIHKLKMAVNSVLKGSLIVALVQGVLSCFGFIIFGIPNPVLWGSLATIAALIPGIGTALVIVPAVIFLFISGQVPMAGGLLVWGVLVVGLIDNFIRPQLIGRGIEIHPLLILLSVLGGIALFGPVGFILGPLSISLLLALFDTYLYLSKKSVNN